MRAGAGTQAAPGLSRTLVMAEVDHLPSFSATCKTWKIALFIFHSQAIFVSHALQSRSKAYSRALQFCVHRS